MYNFTELQGCIRKKYALRYVLRFDSKSDGSQSKKPFQACNKRRDSENPNPNPNPNTTNPAAEALAMVREIPPNCILNPSILA